eukprot:scaffold2172_cov130-Isochrysis_galbana.AAC.11
MTILPLVTTSNRPVPYASASPPHSLLRRAAQTAGLRAAGALPAVRTCRIRGAAKDRPITATDVQSDGRPLALPRHSHGAYCLCAAICAMAAA